MYRLAIVVPVFNEEAVIARTSRELLAVLENICEGWQVVFVDDGSSDGTRDILLKIARSDSRFSVLSLARNFGHQIAVTAGLDMTDCDAAVVIDADLQDPPAVIVDMVREWQLGADIVVGVRRERKGESAFKRFTAAMFYRMMRQQSGGVTAGCNAGDFRLYGNRALIAMRSMREQHRFLRGMSDWVGLKQTHVHFDRMPRAAGYTKYSLRKMINLAWTAFVSFSGGPVPLIGYLATCLVTMGVGLVCMGALDRLGMGNVTVIFGGYVMMCGVVLGALALLGDYLIRIYDEVKGRPLYLVSGVVNLDVPAQLPSGVVVLPASSADSCSDEIRTRVSKMGSSSNNIADAFGGDGVKNDAGPPVSG